MMCQYQGILGSRIVQQSILGFMGCFCFLLYLLCVLFVSDGASVRRRQQQGKHHLPGDAKRNHLPKGSPYQEVCFVYSVVKGV